MDKEKIKYFIYARKSTEGEDRQSLSIEGQLQDNQQVIERNELSVIDTITDTASASVPYNRTGYTEMIRRIKKGEATGIVVWHVDRLIRNELEEGDFKWLLRTGVIKSIWTPNREYKSEDNALLFSIEASMASQYSRDLSVKVKRGLLQKYAKGQPSSVAPIGYLNTKFANHGTNYFIEDPERFHIVRKGFDLLLSGKYNVPQIIAKLNDEYGLRSRKTNKLGGRPVSRSTMFRTFTDPIYSGYFYRKGILYKGSYTPMITVEEFDRIQVILGRTTKAKMQKHEFAFTGFIRCGCGCAITASKKLKEIKSTGEYRTYGFYHCTKRKKAIECTDKKYTTEKEMEMMVVKEIAKIALKPNWATWALQTIEEDFGDELAERNKLLATASEFERKILGELDTLIDLRVNNEITPEQYNQKKADRQAQLIRVTEKRKRLEKNLDNWRDQFNEKLNFTENAVEHFKTADPKQKRAMCADLGWNWTLKAKKLTFSMWEWYIDLAELKGYFEANNGALELIKTFEEYKESAYYEHARSLLRRARDHVRTGSVIPPSLPAGAKGGLARPDDTPL